MRPRPVVSVKASTRRAHHANVCWRKLALKLQQNPAEAEEHIEAVGLLERAVQNGVEVLENVREARKLRGHANLVLVEIAHLTMQELMQRLNERSFSAYASIHDPLEAPEGVDLVLHHHQNRDKKVVHPLHIAYAETFNVAPHEQQAHAPMSQLNTA